MQDEDAKERDYRKSRLGGILSLTMFSNLHILSPNPSQLRESEFQKLIIGVKGAPLTSVHRRQYSGQHSFGVLSLRRRHLLHVLQIFECQ